jgi:hypothetical protein
MAQTAEQLANQQKQQADHVRDLVAQQNAARAGGQQQKYPTAQEIDKMVNDRQKVADDLAHLTQQIRSTARELSSTQPGASSKLRSALDGLDENDLNNRMQRSSDWLRNGNFSDPVESALTGDLQKLGQQVTEAARALGNAQHTSQDAELSQAMDQLSRLRDQLAGLGGRPQGQQGQGQQGQGQQPNGQPGGQQFQSGQLSRNGQPGQPGQQGQPGGQPGQQGKQGQGGQGQGKQGQGGQGQGQGQGKQGQGQGQGGQGQGGQTAQGGQPGGANNGQITNNGPGGGGRGGPAYGNIDTGDTKVTPGPTAVPRPSQNPADTQREIDQALSALNQVRAAVQNNPEEKQQVQTLIDQMRNLDPSRFTGNPALVEQMHQQLVSEVDGLELQLRRRLEESKGGAIRNTDPTKIPPGYQDSVAEYYRKLSGAH